MLIIQIPVKHLISKFTIISLHLINLNKESNFIQGSLALFKDNGSLEIIFMYTIIVLLVFIAFLFLYNLSKKTEWSDKPAWAAYFEKKRILSTVLSAILILIAGVLLENDNGMVSGIFSLIVILMAMGSVIVLLFPFRYVSVKQMALLFLVFIVFEQLIF